MHRNSQLEDKHRIIHLLAGMRAEAKEFMKGFQAIGDNYEGALKTIKDRFGDPTKLAQCYYSDLSNLPDLGSLNDEFCYKS